MPKLSSADTPPEKSSACLPVSTIAESGVITRMPLVCMSIVASAFQYGCAPTLMPATTMLISPPAWVNSTIRLSAAATQSMFSVPDSIEIRAPAESANHSSGTPLRSARSSAAITRRHSGSDSAPSALVGSPSSTTRLDALGHQLGRRADHAGDDRGRVPAPRPVHRHQRAGRRRGRARRSSPRRPASRSARTGTRCRGAPRAAPSAGSRPAAATGSADGWPTERSDAGADVVADRHGQVRQLAGLRVALPGQEEDLLQARARRGRQHAPGDQCSISLAWSGRSAARRR